MVWLQRREFITLRRRSCMAARGARAILSQGTAMISTAISMNSAEIGKRDLHIPDLVDQTGTRLSQTAAWSP
jgi:hypothetical protein